MSTRSWVMLAVAALLAASAGCVSVKAPEKIEIGGGRPEPVDSTRIPETSSHEQAREELRRAYENLQYLERENERLREKAEKYKRERDQYKDRLKRYEKD